MSDPIARLRSLAASADFDKISLDLAKIGIETGHAPALQAIVEASAAPAAASQVEPTSSEVLLAIRALGQLGAVDAISAMTALIEKFPLDEPLENEVVTAWAAMGAPAILPLGTLLLEKDTRTGREVSLDAVRVRILAVTSALRRIGNDPTTRTVALSLLRKAIEPRTPRNIPLVSAALSALLDLNDVESGALIRAAFERGDVNEFVGRTWPDCVEALGLTGEIARPIEEGEGPLRLRLRCLKCDAHFNYRVPRVTVMKPSEDRSENIGRGVLIHKIFTCRSCSAVDEYEVTTQGMIELLSHMSGATDENGVKLVSVGECKLGDGTVVTRVSQGLAHLQTLIAANPTSAIAHRRLGNFAKGMSIDSSVAIEAWTKAVDLDENEVEAALQVALEHVHQGNLALALPFVTRVMRVLPTTRLEAELHWTFCIELMELLDTLGKSEHGPSAIEIAFDDHSRPGPMPARTARLDLRTFDRWATLAQFLFAGLVRSISWFEEPVTSEPTSLLQALDAFERFLEAKSVAEARSQEKRPKTAAPPTVSLKWQSPSKKKKRGR